MAFATETTWPTKLKILTIWHSQERFANPSHVGQPLGCALGQLSCVVFPLVYLWGTWKLPCILSRARGVGLEKGNMEWVPFLFWRTPDSNKEYWSAEGRASSELASETQRQGQLLGLGLQIGRSPALYRFWGTRCFQGFFCASSLLPLPFSCLCFLPSLHTDITHRSHLGNWGHTG
jgi:hypothetical protein